MKKILIFCVLIAAVAGINTGCKKESNTTISIKGKWELRQISGMLSTNYTPGNGAIVKFTSTGYERYQNSQLTESGTYVLVPDNTASSSTCLTLPAGHYTSRIEYSNPQPSGEKVFVDLVDNKLYFISGCYAYDGGSTAQYEKIGD
jgi:hypothetical protein